MSRAGIYYEQGVVVEHNTNPAIKGSGSCIFLHNWARPFETTAGCTVMDPANMKFLINWLDHTKTPVLIQLTKPLYAEFKTLWGLPQINTLPGGL
jgi:D-alanyl-D-alanine dipeptidase